MINSNLLNLAPILHRFRDIAFDSAILDEKRPFCVFEPPLGNLGAMYDDHLRLIGKHVRTSY